MKRAHPYNVAGRILDARRQGWRSGFTLLEICIVLLIIALLATVSIPAIQSAFVEQGLRGDSHELALMVKTAMIQSAEQHRPYVMELNGTTMSLHPQADAAKPADDAATTTSDEAAANAPMVDVSVTNELDPLNKLLAPDPDKTNGWIDMPQTTWTFQPGELCPAGRVRMTRGDSWVEMTFSALTGNVDNEKAYLP